MPNFTILSELFDKHYKKWDPLNESDTKSSKEQRRNSKPCIEIMAFWLQVIVGVGHEPITDDLLKEVADKFSGVNNGRRKRPLHYLVTFFLRKKGL